MTEPLPDTGWSRETITIRNALVVPPEIMTGQPVCGVYADGRDCLHASTWRNGIRMTLAIDEPPAATAHLAGRHVWGGLYFGHFGHFMTETMSRCWGFDQPGAESVIFVPKHARLRDFSNYQTDFWQLMNLGTPETVIREPTTVEELVIPGQGFGLGNIALGTPEFRARMRELAARVEPIGPERIYISRTRFNGRGGIIDEPSMEANFTRNGYAIMHPERLSLIEQLQHYKAASHIIGLDSSAFHIAGMVADPTKRIAFILRRDNKAYGSIAAQIEGMIGHPPDIIDALVANWMVTPQKIANHLSWGEIDHADLARQLEDLGYIENRANWSAPSDEAMKLGVEQAVATSKEELVRRPRAATTRLQR